MDIELNGGDTLKSTRRLEYKYRISYKEYIQLKPLLENLLIHDKHGLEDSYPITSIYLDDVYHSGAMDKAFGNEHHKKYRLRYYHDPNQMKLELKEKVGHDAVKSSVPISNKLYQAILNHDLDVLEEHFSDPLIRRYTLDMLRYHYVPQATIYYLREAYKDPSDNVRITFDHLLQVSPFLPEESLEYLHLMRGSDLILEVKYEHYLPKEVQAVLRRHKLHQISVSKYFLGYEQITT